MAFLEWVGVSKVYAGTRALDRVSLSVDKGEVLGILGPSGSGKTTLLRLAAGLEEADSGRVLLDGEDLSGVPPHRRNFGLMFQDYCLFPHLSVSANIGFGLRMKKWGREPGRRRVEEMLKLVRMQKFSKRDIHSLSGGEQQRIALARSLAPSPRLLMLDEPLGALDAALRKELLVELSGIVKQVGVTTVYVTHDQEEAMTVAGRIALLRAGKLEQLGTPADIIRQPANAFVSSFLSLGAVIAGTRRRQNGAWVLETDIGAFPVKANPGRKTLWRTDIEWKLLVRPGSVSFSARPGAVKVRARVVSRTARPEGMSLRLAIVGKNGNIHLLELPAGPWSSGGKTPPFGAEGALWVDPTKCSLVQE